MAGFEGTMSKFSGHLRSYFWSQKDSEKDFQEAIQDN